MEEWRAVVGFEDFYEVSSFGRVRSLRCGKSKILRACPDSDGYPRVILMVGRKRTDIRVHRMVALAFHGDGVYPRRTCKNDRISPIYGAE